MIKLVNVSKIYNNNGVLTTGLHNVSLEFSRNEIVAITGESGSGKSTLLNVLTKMDFFDEGEYYYKGNETSYFDVNDLDDFRKNKVGFIFQNYNIIDSYTVLENVMLPFILKGIDEKEAKQKAMDLIKKVGLKNRCKNRGVQLSGGEKQRCVIARALASDCEILACDEPTGNLDSKTSIEIIKLIKEVAKDKLVLIVTHNFEQVKDIVTRKIKIHDGEVMEDIVYENFPLDEEKKLNLDYVKLPKKTKFKLALKNLINTPKKTILTFAVLLSVAVFALFLYQTIYYFGNNQFYNNSFFYKGEDKLIVYDMHEGGKQLDKEKLEQVSSKFVVNDFYHTGYVPVMNFSYKTTNMFGYEKYPYDFSLDGGRMPRNDDECVLLIQPNVLKEKDFLNTTFYIDGYFMETDYQYKIVGYQFREDVERPTITQCDNFEKLILLNTFYTHDFYLNYHKSYTNNSGTIDITGKEDVRIMLDMELDKSLLQLGKNLTLGKTDILQSNFYFLNYTFDYDISLLEKEDSENGDTNLILGNDFFDMLKEQPYEASVYVDNINEATRKLNSFGYTYVRVKNYNTTSNIEHFLMNFTSYMMMIGSSVVFIIIYFISYVILAKIYSSRKKDYTILRTLGVSRKDMKGIVEFEVMLLTVVISVVTYLTIFITSRFYQEGAFVLFKKITIGSSIIYFAVMLLFGYFVALRFNRKLFKFSVNATLKGGEAKND